MLTPECVKGVLSAVKSKMDYKKESKQKNKNNNAKQRDHGKNQRTQQADYTSSQVPSGQLHHRQGRPTMGTFLTHILVETDPHNSSQLNWLKGVNQRFYQVNKGYEAPNTH